MLNIKLSNKTLIILGLLLIGFVLRLININQSLWLDEAISVELVKNPLFLAKFSSFMRGDFNPPLFNIILFFWLKIFPAQELFIRLPSVIFGLAACYFTYKIGELFDKKIAILSLILLITSPLHIYYSQEARMYSLATFGVIGSMYYFIKFITTKNKLFTIYYLLFTVLTFYSHYLAWLIMPVQWLYLIIQRNKKIIPNYLTTQLLITLSLIPLLPLLLLQLNIGQKTANQNQIWKQIVGGPNIKNFLLLPIKFIIGRTSFDNKNFYYLTIALLVLFFWTILWKAKIHKYQVRLEYSAPGAEKLIWLWLVVPPLLGAVISFKIPVFSYFRFLFCLPAFYLLLARGVYNLRKLQFAMIILITINFFFSQRYLLNKNYHRENWQEAVKILHLKNSQHNQVLIFQNVSAPFVFYDQGQSRIIYTQQKEILNNESVLWYIPYAQPIFDPHDETRTFLQNNGFVRIYEEHFNGVTLEKWQKTLVFGYNNN